MDQQKFSEKPEVKLHFLDYWRVIRMRKSLILTVFLLVVITTTVMTFWFLPERYSSSAVLKIEQDAPDISLTDYARASRGYDPYFLNTEFQIIRSPRILYGVITNNLNLCDKYAKQREDDHPLSVDEACQILSRRIKVDQFRSTSMVEIWVTDSDKNLAKQIADEIVSEYIKYRTGSYTTNRNTGLDAVKTNLTEVTNELAVLEKKQDKYQKDHNLPIIESNPYTLVNMNEERLRQVHSYLQQARAVYIHDHSLLEQVLSVNTNELKNTIGTILPTGNELAPVMERFGEAQRNFTAISGTYGKSHPDYQASEKIYTNLQREVETRVAGMVDGLRKKVASDSQEIKQLENEYDIANSNKTASAELIRPYVQMSREIEDLRELKSAIVKRIVGEKAEISQPMHSVEEISYPTVGFAPVSPNKPLNLALGIIVGLIVGVGLAFFIEYLDTSVKTIDDVERALEAPVLAVIPQQVGILLEEGLDSPHAEAYRVLRTNLLFARKDDTWNTVTVLSGGAGEGKSTTLFNLATVFAQAGARVLVIDSDLNRPSIHKMLRVSNTIGLTDYLLGKHKLEEIIQTTPQVNMDFMPSGKLPRTSMGILSSMQMKEMVKEVKKRYDYVFFDSPPLLGVSDASVIASLMDMTMQVIQYRRYPQLMTIRAKQMILKVGGHLMGIVLNNINMSQDENYYYYSGYYEYKSKQKDGAEVKTDKPEEGSAKKKTEVEIKQK